MAQPCFQKVQKIIHFYKNQLPPVRWLFWFVVGILTLSFIFAPEPQPVDWDTYQSKTTADSRMYFHNIRSFYYYRYPEEKPPMVLYRFKEREKDSSRVQMYFTIVQNVLTDEVFTVLEWRNLPAKKENLQLYALTEKDTNVLSINYLNAQGEYEIASVVYNTLQQEGRFYLAAKNKKPEGVLETSRQRKVAKTVLTDYFKLINKLKN